MLFVALASDYDGTLAHDGCVERKTVEALKRLKAAGKRLVLVTGREIRDLKAVFEDLPLFDIVVGENGAVLYFPQTLEERSIAPEPPANFVAALQAKEVAPLSIGRGIVATWTPNEQKVLEVIRELGLDWQLTFNKGAVMCLAPGVNKATGLTRALEELKLSASNVVAVGDAENDQAFLNICGCSVAVANALQPVKDAADLTTRAKYGAGVAELIDGWLDHPAQWFDSLHRHHVYLGDAPDQTKIDLAADRGSVLIAGSSGAGKSRLTSLLIERLLESRCQLCIVDPEGDYTKLEGVTHLGDSQRTAAPDEVLSALRSPQVSVVASLLGTDVARRPEYFHALMGQIRALYLASGRPHWLILDEAHHLCPRTDAQSGLAADLSALFITTHPEHLSRAALMLVTTVIAVGAQANAVIEKFCELTGLAAPAAAAAPSDEQVLLWSAKQPVARVVNVARSRQHHQRHTRKYVEGRLGEDISFYFRGADGALNLRAYNLAAFLELAQGVDDDTWTFHFKRSDYAQWFKTVIKDEELSAEVRSLSPQMDAQASRQAVAEAIKKRYVINSGG